MIYLEEGRFKTDKLKPTLWNGMEMRFSLYSHRTRKLDPPHQQQKQCLFKTQNQQALSFNYSILETRNQQKTKHQITQQPITNLSSDNTLL